MLDSSIMRDVAKIDIHPGRKYYPIGQKVIFALLLKHLLSAENNKFPATKVNCLLEFMFFR